MTPRSQPPSWYTKTDRSARRSYGGWHGLLPAALTLSRTLESEMDQALAFTRLSAASFVVLLNIARESPPSQEALARGLALTPGSLSDQLLRLERSGLVRRNPARRGGGHPGSAARLPTATLTDRGVAVLAEAEAIAARVERGWARRLADSADSPWPVARALGLRRWLTESRAALTKQTRRDERAAGGTRRGGQAGQRAEQGTRRVGVATRRRGKSRQPSDRQADS